MNSWSGSVPSRPRTSLRAGVGPRWTSRIGAGFTCICEHPLGEVGDLVEVDALVREHHPLLGRVRTSREVEGADEAADGQAAGGVLVEVDRGFGVVVDVAALLPPGQPRRRPRGRGGRTPGPTRGHRPGSGRASCPGRGRAGTAPPRTAGPPGRVRPSEHRRVPRQADPEEASGARTSRRTAGGRLRPGHVRPGRRRLHRRGRRARCARAPGAGPRARGSTSRSSPTTRRARPRRWSRSWPGSAWRRPSPTS